MPVHPRTRGSCRWRMRAHNIKQNGCFAPLLLDKGVVAMVGKGERNKAVCDAIVRNKAVYLCAIGGAGALASKCIKSCKVIAYDDLGCESVKELKFEDFPLTVAVDCSGGNVFEEKVNIKYLEELYFVYFGFLYIFYIKKEAFNSSFYLYFTIDF